MFSVGQIVSVRADRNRKGPVIAVVERPGGLKRYRVFHANQEIREYQEEQLVLVGETVAEDSIAESLSAGQWISANDFRGRLTVARLSNPQLDSLYSLHSARIKFIPFQFKPLLRFLRADAPRILIADEVGVGKTIEAGLILKELTARHNLENVLIVCPKALTTKWHAEMRRFDEEFKILTAESLAYCLKETHQDGVWPLEYSRSLIHLELLRMSDYTQGRGNMPGLFTLSPGPRFNLLIVDEAHHVRNQDTSSHQVARYLCDQSESVVFLSATPVHVGSQNLFSLLNLLRPEIFLDQSVFQEMVEPNRHIIDAMRVIRTAQPGTEWTRDALIHLRQAESTSWGARLLRQDPRFLESFSRLSRPEALSDEERIRCLRDLEEVHSLSVIMNRTRRRDIGRFTIREPKTVTVEFTKPQKEFYDAIIEFRREVLRLNYNPAVVGLITDTLQRQAASCLPALAPAIDSFLHTGKFRLRNISDDIEDETEEIELLPHIDELAAKIRVLASSLPPEDPKGDKLISEIIEPSMQQDGPSKVLVFSFFLHTLTYLKKLIVEKSGRRVAIINGDVPEEDRERLRQRFRLPFEDNNAIDVLLSSEVGCEGLDYEFCDRLVNYDIPWNPMRLEQRIGRIDRFGQQSPKVFIFNFITPGTVEERIYFRCFERLGIFRETIGDLEEVLGSVMQDLNKAALDPSLSESQREELTRQTIDNALRMADEQRRLEEESSSILGLDQALLQEFDALRNEGRFLDPDDLRHLVALFLGIPQIKGSLIADTKNQALERIRIPADGKEQLLLELGKLGERNRQLIEFRRWLETSERELLVTFDQETALQQRNVAFITPMHPFVKLAVNHWKNSLDPLIVSSLVVTDEAIPPGRYMFVCDLWEYVALHTDLRLVGAAWNIDEQRISSELSSGLVKMLTRVQQPDTNFIPSDSIVHDGLQALDDFVESRRRSELEQLIGRNNFSAQRQLASLEVYFNKRLKRLKEEIAVAKEDKIRRMKESEFSRVSKEQDSHAAEIRQRMDADILSRRVAAGLIEVRAS